MTAAEMQQAIDARGYLQVPAGVHSPECPVFIDRGQADVFGVTANSSRLDLGSCGTAFGVGWRRGMVPDDHFTPEGFRSFAKVNLFARGTEWDLGPIRYPSPSGWSRLSSLRVVLSATLHGDDWRFRHPNGTVFDTYLCGIAGLSPAAGSPSPWHLGWDPAGGVRFGFPTTEG